MRKILLWMGIVSIVYLSYFVGDIVNTVSIKRIPSYGSIILMDNKWQILTKKWRSGWYMAPYTGSLERDIIRHIVEIEDKRFWKHNGIDIYGKIASIEQNIRAWWIIRGWSTITEQYIKNVYYPGSKRTITQKIREWIASLIVENLTTKDEILRGYLDNIYFWNNIYWLAWAEDIYFQWKIWTQDDILDIITRINSPNMSESRRWWIIGYREKIRKRLNIGTEVTSLFDAKNQLSLNRYPIVTERILEWVELYCSGNKERLLKWVNRIESDICNSPLVQIRLSLDGDLMEYSRIALESILSPLTSKNVTNGSVYIIQPTTNKVLAYIANRQSSNRWDNAIDMIRQRRSVGSILKPFVYLLALEMWHDANDFILDDTRIYPTGYGNKWFIPMNYVEKSYWPVRMREALWNSLNSSTVRLSEEIGIGQIYDFFRKNNLDLNHDAGYYGYGITLGSVELSLENIVESYRNLIDRENSNLIILEDILKDATNRARTFWISSILNTSIPLAVKTWTSTDFRDNWTVSYNKDAIIWIWVGNSDASPMEDVSGVSWAWPLWHSIAEYMISRRLITNDISLPPSELQLREICLDTNCYQKELRFSKKEKSPKSRPIHNLYYESDFITRMTKEEMEKWKIRSE
jgi:penicillin-binding protein 1C